MNNFYQGNNNGYYNQGMGIGYNNQTIPVPKMTQVLTNEQINSLKKNAIEFTLNPEPNEVLRAKCTHRHNGNFTLIDNQDGTMTCSICGKTWPMIEDLETATEITEGFVALLQSIKTYFLDLPEKWVDDFFRIIPVVEKMPQLFKISQENFYRYNNNNNDMLQQRGGYSFGMLDAIGAGYNPYAGQQFGNPAFGQPQQQFVNPAFGQQQYNPAFGQPQYNPAFGQPQQQFGNPAFGQQQQVGNPLTTDGATAPGYAFGQGQQQNVTTQETVTTTKQFQK